MAFPIEVMTEVVQVRPRTATSGRGVALTGEQYEERCYLEPETRMTVDERGQDVTSELWGVFRSSCEIVPGDEITWAGRIYRAVTVEPFSKAGSIHHIEIRFAGTR